MGWDLRSFPTQTIPGLNEAVPERSLRGRVPAGKGKGGCRAVRRCFPSPAEDGGAQLAPGLVCPTPARGLRAGRGRGGGEVSGVGAGRGPPAL